jgi:hypothetical protein
MQLGLDVLPDGLAPPGTGGLPAPVAGLRVYLVSCLARVCTLTHDRDNDRNKVTQAAAGPAVLAEVAGVPE